MVQSTGLKQQLATTTIMTTFEINASMLVQHRHIFLAACMHNGRVFLICVSHVTELLRHTHHRSYSCNGAKHGSNSTTYTTIMTTVQICLLWLLRLLRH